MKLRFGIKNFSLGIEDLDFVCGIRDIGLRIRIEDYRIEVVNKILVMIKY